jgi:phosphate transport system substrate-binding protein
MRHTRFVVAALAAGVIAVASFAAAAGAQPAKERATSISGAGSTFVAPLIGQWINSYKDATITYNPVGSGAGITAVSGRTVDFGATDAPPTVDQFTNCRGCVMVPWALSASAILYNLPGVKNNIHLTGSVIADMYLGKISKWNDARIRKLNPGVSLPDTDVTPVYRSDGSGTTFNVTDFLSASSKTFQDQIGHNTAVDWPKGVGARGSSGVSGVLTRTEGAIGYADIAYAKANKLQFAAVQNASGKFALPGLRGIKAAAQADKKFDSRNFLSIVNPPKGKKYAQAYPICTYTYVLVPTQSAKSADLKAFITWAITDGQALGTKLIFQPLPAYVVAHDKVVLKRLSTA